MKTKMKKRKKRKQELPKQKKTMKDKTRYILQLLYCMYSNKTKLKRSKFK